MEVAAAIGLTASIATLAKSAKLLFSLAQDVHHASKDIEELKEAVEDICLQTKLLERLLNDLPLMQTSMRPVDEKLVADLYHRQRYASKEMSEMLRRHFRSQIGKRAST